MTVVKNTPFRKEYVTGMKDLFDLMWDVEENAYRQTKSKEEYHDKLKEGFSYIISRIGKSRAQDLKEEMGIV